MVIMIDSTNQVNLSTINKQILSNSIRTNRERVSHGPIKYSPTTAGSKSNTLTMAIDSRLITEGSNKPASESIKQNMIDLIRELL